MSEIVYSQDAIKAKNFNVPIISMQDKSVKHVLLTGSVGYGISNEQEIESAHMIEHLTFEGTKKFPDKKTLSDIAPDLGGQMNAMTGNDFTLYFTLLPADSSALGVDLITDVLFSPLLEEKELSSVKQIIPAELGRREGTDSYRAMMLFFQAFYPENRYGYIHSYEKRVQSVKNLAPEQIRANYHKHYIPANMSFFIGGNFDKSKLCDLLRESVQNKFQEVSSDAKELRTYSDPEYRHLKIEENFKTDYVTIGFKAPDAGTPEYYPMSILEYITGGKPTARIPFRLRAKEGLSYATKAYYLRSDGKGVFFIQTDVKKGETEKAQAIIIEELSKIRKEGLSQEELEKAKKALIGRIHTMDGTLAKLLTMHSDYYDFRRLVTPDEKAKELDAITNEDMVRVAQKVIPEEFTPETYASARLVAK